MPSFQTLMLTRAAALRRRTRAGAADHPWRSLGAHIEIMSRHETGIAAIEYVIVNSEFWMLTYGRGQNRFQIKTRDAWKPVTHGTAGVYAAGPAQSLSRGERSPVMSAQLPTDLPAGRYRLVKNVTLLKSIGNPVRVDDRPFVPIYGEFQLPG